MRMKRILLVASEDTIENAKPVPGAEIVPFPVIGFERMAVDLPDPTAFDWVFFGSRQGARVMLEHDPAGMKRVRIGAVGSRTADYLARYGLVPEFVPRRFSSRSWPSEFVSRFPGKCSILYPTSDKSTFQGEPVFQEHGIELTTMTVYRTVCHDLPLPGNLDAIVFASPSCFTCFLNGHGLEPLRGLLVTAIGEVTESRIRSEGLDCLVPERFTIQDALNQTCKYLEIVK